MKGFKREHGGNRLEVAWAHGHSLDQLIDFSANINPFGPPPSVFESIRENLSEVAHYPDHESRGLKEALAEYLSVKPSSIILGNGSVELIYLLTNYFRPRFAIIPAPTFCEYELAIKAVGGEVIHIRLEKEDGFTIHINEILEVLPRVQMVFLCNPNNPTGNLFAKEDLLQILERADELKVVFILDEAYMDFVEERERFSLIREVEKRENIFVLGSLTKFFALAGLRVGYAVANSRFVGELNFIKNPWNINCFAQVAGVSALRDIEFMKRSRIKIRENGHHLFMALSGINGLKPYPPQANFMLVEIKHWVWDSKKLQNELARRRLLIRDCESFRGLGKGFIRLAIRTREENEKLIDALKEILSS
ncbi:MAG: threonine-phosphate decarboxylase CobD [Actinomycetota bacterium]|nr:threonine-phosphate decarboxylase CobD [Actinomycetota bacterium]MDI6822007.1 threonine-phosphate decarboxylase CobD [Actinomycetota bacterium]